MLMDAIHAKRMHPQSTERVILAEASHNLTSRRLVERSQAATLVKLEPQNKSEFKCPAHVSGGFKICNKFGPKSESCIKATQVKHVKRTESTSKNEVKS